jgi:phage-related protein
MPVSRPMPSIGPGCHELRVDDDGRQWRLVYRIDFDAILVVDVIRKTTQKTPKRAIERCERRLRDYGEQQ